jgi:hypothetical protein
MSLTERLLGVTTLLTVSESSENFNGSGFFYRQLESNAQGWVKILDTWLVTNRHVLVNSETERFADSLTFRVRHINEDNTLRWNEIKLNRESISFVSMFSPGNRLIYFSQRVNSTR